METSVFSKIISGEIPCHKVYENEDSFAFMDIHPVQPGMVVIVAKKVLVNAEELSEESYLGVMKSVRKISKALRAIYPEKFKIAVRIEGLDVQHAHVTVFPIDNHEDFHADATTEEPNHEELENLAVKIRTEIENVE